MATIDQVYTESARECRETATRYRAQETDRRRMASRRNGAMRDVAERSAKAFALRAELEERIASELWEARR